MAKEKKEELVVRDVAEMDIFGDGEDFASVRLEISCGNSACVGEGLIPVAHFYLKEDDEVIDLGVQTDVAILAMRAKALAFDPLRISYTQNSELFAGIVGEKDAGSDGASYGPEFLCYGEKGFFTFYLKSITNKKRGKSLGKMMGKTVSITVDKVSNDKFTWYSFKTKLAEEQLIMPPEMQDKIKAFAEAEDFSKAEE